MIAFFVILVVLMVLVVAAGSWRAGPRRRVRYERDAVVDRSPRVLVEPSPEVIEEVVYDEAYPPPDASTRRVVRRRRTVR